MPLALLLSFFTVAAWQWKQSKEPPPPANPLYTEEERKAVVDYWNAPGRYVAGPSTTDAERINITVPGSTWYSNFLKAQREGKDTGDWNSWFKDKMHYDRAMIAYSDDAPAEPGPIPQSLKDAIGEPPPLYEKVQPSRYVVTFDPKDAPAPIEYVDSVPFGDRANYIRFYRSTSGVMRAGRRVKDYSGEERGRLEKMFENIGGSPFERHVLQAVSALEGGFEAINTYDTGWVSIGFIQFITAIDGNGSLASVLQRHKKDDPKDFEQTFRRFGIDVGANPTPVMVVVDPVSGKEFWGADAVRTIIMDKRLTAVFERAGGMAGFRRAQILTARAQYWPGDEPIKLSVSTLLEQGSKQDKPKKLGTYYGNAEAHPEVIAAMAAEAGKQKKDPGYKVWLDKQTETVSVSDVIKSEAGMATLMDRKVNRGNIREINDVMEQLQRECSVKSLEELSKYERRIIVAMKYRADYLSEKNLTQPPPLPTERAEPTKSPGASNTPGTKVRFAGRRK